MDTKEIETQIYNVKLKRDSTEFIIVRVQARDEHEAREIALMIESQGDGDLEWEYTVGLDHKPWVDGVETELPGRVKR